MRRLNLEPTRFTESLEEHAEPQRRTWVYQGFDGLRVFMSVQVMHRSLLTLCFGLSASQAGAEMGDLSLFSRQGRVLYHMVSWARSALDTQENVGARSKGYACGSSHQQEGRDSLGSVELSEILGSSKYCP